MTDLMVRQFAYIFDRHEGTRELAETEATHLTGGEVVTPGMVVGSHRIDVSGSAYLRAGGQLLAHDVTLDELCVRVRALGIVGEDFKVIAEPIPRNVGGDFRAVTAVAGCIDGRANLKAPKDMFLLVISADGFWLIRSEAVGRRDWLAFKHKPYPFSNALPIRIGRAILNIVCKEGDTVLDPCCGSGTFPLLASQMGLMALGGDKSWPNMDMARKNMAHFGQQGEFKQEDARHTERQADVLVTNLPYDLYLPLEADVLVAMLKNFKRLAPVVVLVSSQDLLGKITDAEYAIRRELCVKKHNLGRNIYFLFSDY